MKSRLTQANRRRGAALFTVLIVMGVLTIAVTGMIFMASQQPNLMRKARDMFHARAIAEAGANVAYAMLSTNFALKDTPAAFPAASYRDGVYDATVTSISSTSAVISSVGTYNTATYTVAMDVKNLTTNAPGGGGGGSGAFYNYAVASASSIDTGNSNAGQGIQGDVRAPSITDKKNKITGTKTIGAVDLTNFIDFQPYLDAANNGGTVLTGPLTLQNYTAPGNGIVWINGAVSLKGNVTGCIIATGNVTANGGFTHTKVGNFPGIMSQNGNFSANNSTAQGLIYTRIGTVSLGGNFVLVGSVICAGGFDCGGGGTVIYANSTPVPPGATTTQNNVGISGWRQ
jgi:hypothetical protein